MHSSAAIAQPALLASPAPATPVRWPRSTRWRGLLLSATLAAVAIGFGRLELLQNHGIGALTLAIVLGMLLGNTAYPQLAPFTDTGVVFAKQRLLRLGIVLYGFRLTFQDIGQVGLAGVVIDALVLASTFGIAVVLGTKVFKLERTTALLIGAGSAICGAAAVMATEPVVRGRPDQVTVAISTVVVFGTLAIFLYPALYALNQSWHLLASGPAAFGIYTGSTVHEVAQVVAAARAIGADAANAAVIAKMVRVMMLAPFLVLLSAYLAHRDNAQAARPGHPDGTRARIVMPWFALVFVVVAGVNSLALLPAAVVAAITDLDTFVLAMAMVALGLTTHVSAIRRAGFKPLLLAAILFGWLIGGGALINAAVHAWFA